jgi:Glycoside-hydrolase family GH114
MAMRPRLALILAACATVLLCAPAALARYKPLPASGDSWYWEIDPPKAGVSGLPPISAPYPRPGSARIWDTDLFFDSNTSSARNLGIPTGPSRVIAALHRDGHYSICYVEAGAYQTNFPDGADFAPGDYGHRAKRYQLQGFPTSGISTSAGSVTTLPVDAPRSRAPRGTSHRGWTSA